MADVQNRNNQPNAHGSAAASGGGRMESSGPVRAKD